MCFLVILLLLFVNISAALKLFTHEVAWLEEGIALKTHPKAQSTASPKEYEKRIRERMFVLQRALQDSKLGAGWLTC